MKILILSCLSAAALVSFSACEDEREHHHDHNHGAQVTTTTTEETTVHQPVDATTETRTIRAY
jgi:hypothetical protein